MMFPEKGDVRLLVKRKKKNNINMQMCMTVVSVVAVVIYLYIEKVQLGGWQLFGETQIRFVETNVSQKYNYEDKAAVYAKGGDKHYYFATRDGIRYLSSTGETKWEHPYSMNNPVLKGEGGHAAVCDINGNTMYVFTDTGILYSPSFEAPVLSFSINTRGDSVVILKNGEDYIIRAFTASGEVSIDWPCVDYGFFPIALDISNDGLFLAVSFLDINSVKLTSRLRFVYLNKESTNGDKADEDEADFLSGFNWQDELVASIHFMDNNNLLVLSDNMLSCMEIDMKNGMVPWAKKKWEMPSFSNKIDGFVLFGEKRFAIAFGETLPGKQAENEGVVCMYDLNLNMTGEYNLGRKVTYLGAGSNGVIVGAGRSFTALNAKAAVLWQHTVTSDVNQLVSLDTINTIVEVTKINANVMKREKQKTADDNVQETEVLDEGGSEE